MIEIIRTGLSEPALRAPAGTSGDGTVIRRLPAIAFIPKGRCRTEAALRSRMTRQTPGDGVHCRIAKGRDGLRLRITDQWSVTVQTGHGLLVMGVEGWRGCHRVRITRRRILRLRPLLDPLRHPRERDVDRHDRKHAV